MTDIGFAGLAVTGLLVLVAIGLSLWRQLGLEGSIAWAAVRAAVQLLAVGGVLTVLLDPDVSILWSWLWVVAMILFAAFTVRRRAPEVPRLFTLALGRVRRRVVRDARSALRPRRSSSSMLARSSRSQV